MGSDGTRYYSYQVCIYTVLKRSDLYYLKYCMDTAVCSAVGSSQERATAFSLI